MEPGKITEKLANLVREFSGISEVLPAATGLVGTNTKFLGKISELIPTDPVQKALAYS